MSFVRAIKSTIFLLGMSLSACSTQNYVDISNSDAPSIPVAGNIVYHLHEAYTEHPPDCVAVLPFTLADAGEASESQIDQPEAVRRAFYAHIAPQGKRDVELTRINFVMNALSDAEGEDLSFLGNELHCDTLVMGEVTEYVSDFYAVYSRVAVGAKIKMKRASDGKLLWEGEHTAESHGGTVPLSPIGLAMGIYDAATNVNEEQLFRVADDLARRLVSTIPDDQTAVLDEPIVDLQQVTAKVEDRQTQLQEFLSSIERQTVAEQKERVFSAIDDETFSKDDENELFLELIRIGDDDAAAHNAYAKALMGWGNYENALDEADRALSLDNNMHDMHFLKGRAYIKLQNLDQADRSIVQAIAISGSSAPYLNGLGYVNSIQGNFERALASYQMALEHDPRNGYAYYNMGVTLYSLGDLEASGDSFYGAGLAYLSSGDYGQAEKALNDLKSLVLDGVQLTGEIDTLSGAIEDLEQKGGSYD